MVKYAPMQRTGADQMNANSQTDCSFALSCCSTADLAKEHFDRRNIRYLMFHFSLGGVEYVDDLGQTIPFEEFYARMVKGEMTDRKSVV